MPKSPKKKQPQPTLPKSLRKGRLPRTVAEVWEAGLGALGASASKGQFDALVAEGRRVESLGGKAVRRALRSAERAAVAAADAVAPVVETTVEEAERLAEAVLGAAGVPQRGEVDALRAHVRLLEARLVAMTGSAPVAVRVEPAASGWAVRVAGAEASAHRTKKDALAEARRAARAHAPSRLVVCTADGTPGEPVDYGP